MPSIGVIGAGSRGMEIIRLCEKHGALGGVADVSIERLRRICSEFPDVPSSRDADAVFRSSVDAIAIATPVRTHVELALRAIHHGKHVFVDRPLSISEEGAIAVVRKADRAGRKVFVGHQLLHHPAVVAQRRLIHNGEIGDIVHVRARRLTSGGPRSDENVWWHLAPDDVALILELLGEPISVAASQHFRLGSAIIDFVYADLQFVRHRSAHIEVSWIDPDQSSRIDVFGTKGIASVETELSVPRLTLELSQGYTAGQGALRSRDHASRIVTFPQADPSESEFLAFVHALSEDYPAICDATNGVGTARVLNAVTRAGLHRSGDM